ncbi:ABC transporter ATP-binding protein [Desulfotomaculum sp. 1211_IL3151]|uniref:ABC transporter ATP-binding protein n=1 Tax=Desulfotomaculum sp. 1211_IL3151 TaxID=3084055 RepID=UPI002FDB3115
MILLQTNNISKYFGVKQVLKNVTISIQDHEKIGLVGVNGAGKSTLLKILTAQHSPDGGDIFKQAGLTIGYLAQDSGLDSQKSIYEEMLSVFQHLMDMEHKLRQLEETMGQAQLNNPAAYQKIMEEYAHLSDTFRDLGGYSYHSLIRGVLQGLNFSDLDHNSPISSLSGGQKTRLALAKNLLSKPNLLILDEPTNYLDIHTLSWLEQHLQTYTGAVLVVSHDRYFLDMVVNRIIELEHGTAATYKTNYSGFIDLKAQQQETQLKQFEQQQEVIAKTKDFIQRNIVRASTTRRAQSRMKLLEKMELVEAPISKQQVYFSFDINRQSGKDVLQTSRLSIGYPNTKLAINISFSLERGESLALLGPNGIGKSTLLKTIIGQLSPIEGNIRLGTNVSIGYYAQQQEKLCPQKTVLDELWDDYRLMDEKDVRTVLGNFLFREDDVYKKVAALSGGERARLSLAKLMLEKANLLILDEPTNHLDILSREVLESALLDYPGTILFVSHDRYFLNKMASRIIELNPTGVTSYLGNYDYYLAKKAEKSSQSNQIATVKEQVGKQSYLENKELQRQERKRLKRIEELEQLIAQTEADINQLEISLASPAISQDYTACLELSREIDGKRSKIDSFLEEWLTLTE